MKKRTRSYDEPWYAVRTLYEWGRFLPKDPRFFYEERIVLIRDRKPQWALRQADKEARKYAKDGGFKYLGIAGIFHLFDETLTTGAELYSRLHSVSARSRRAVTHFFGARTYPKPLKQFMAAKRSQQ